MAESTTRRHRRRSPHEGSVYRNGARWRGAVTWTEPDGTRQRRIVSAPTAAEARDKLDKLRDRLRLGVLERAGSGTVADYFPAWVERQRARVRPSTWRMIESHSRTYLVPSLGRISLARLSAADIERAMAGWLRDGRPGGRPASPMTVQHVRATLRRALSDAVKAGLVARNVAADASPPYAAHRPVTYLGAQDVRRLLDSTREDPLDPLYAVAVSTGMRLGELLGLGWDDVDIPGGSLTVRHTLARDYSGAWSLAEPKTARSRRTIPLPAIARDALDRQFARQTADRLAAGSIWQDRQGLAFTDPIGRPLRPDHVSSSFQRTRSALGLPPVRFADLRHSAATLMLSEGVPLAVISEALGHAGIQITMQHYAAVVPQLRREAAAAMDRALGG